MKVIIFTWSNHHLVTKTSCFGMRFIHFTTLCNTLFTNKTTCFGLMKVNEGKSFAFISEICWLSTLYANYEGKLDFKQKKYGDQRGWKWNNLFEWYSNTMVRDTILSENNKELQDFLIFNTTLPKIITYRIVLFLCIILFFPKLFCTFVTVSVDLAKIFSAENEVNENGTLHT